MSAGRDPAGAHAFALEIDGVEVASFLGCDGPRSRTEVVEIEEGGVNDRVHRRPGRTTWDNLVLRTSSSTSPALWSWRDDCRAGEHAQRRSGALTIYRDDGRPFLRYELVGMWPVRWTGPALDAAQGALAVEELEISVDDVRLG